METIVKKKKKGVQYFTQDTENAIVLYNNTLDPEERSNIYRERIHYGFFKLTENIIHTFKFYYTEVDNIEDLQHEVEIDKGKEVDIRQSMILTIIILSLLVVTLGFTTFNLLRKNEKQEDILAGYMTYLNKVSDTIEEADKKLQEVDHRGSFKADDEIGFVFEQIKSIQTILNTFIIKEIK